MKTMFAWFLTALLYICLIAVPIVVGSWIMNNFPVISGWLVKGYVVLAWGIPLMIIAGVLVVSAIRWMVRR